MMNEKRINFQNSSSRNSCKVIDTLVVVSFIHVIQPVKCRLLCQSLNKSLINSQTTATLILLPSNLYCCFSFTVEGKLKSSGNDINRRTSRGLKNLKPSDFFSSITFSGFESITFNFSSSSVFVIEQKTDPVPSMYLVYDLVKHIELVESKVQMSNTWNLLLSTSSESKKCLSVWTFVSRYSEMQGILLLSFGLRSGRLVSCLVKWNLISFHVKPSILLTYYLVVIWFKRESFVFPRDAIISMSCVCHSNFSRRYDELLIVKSNILYNFHKYVPHRRFFKSDHIFHENIR